MDFKSDDFVLLYEIGDKLGNGHFAEVKHCTKKEDRSEYAAKFIRRRQLLDPKHVGMNLDEIEREAHILKTLNHQNIIKLFCCYDLGKNIVLLLELVSGGELFDYISDSERLSEEEASQFIEQIVLGLNHMHDHNVVHLDLKPENVMIENLIERKIKLIDFGLAREIKNKSTIIEMQGTAEFLAPEVIEYNPISFATDMWAIGVITYIMLTGVSPFSGDDQISTFQNITNCRLEFDEEICSDMTESAKSFISSLLILDAKKRAKASDCLVHPWIKPMEQSMLFRRRSSIISREKLQSLKHFVICPSPSSSGGTTPRCRRKNQKEDFPESPEEVANDYGSDKESNRSLSEDRSAFQSSSSENVPYPSPLENHFAEDPNEIQDQSDVEVLLCELHCTSQDDTDSTVTDLPCSIDDPHRQPKPEDSEGDQNADRNNVDNASYFNNGRTSKQKINSAISNSVRKFNLKFESLASLFDSKNKSSIPPKTHGRGSLKNLFTINSDPFFSDQSKTSLFIAATSCDKESHFNSKQGSESVATSPTIFKRSMFFSRYGPALDSKKK